MEEQQRVLERSALRLLLSELIKASDYPSIEVHQLRLWKQARRENAHLRSDRRQPLGDDLHGEAILAHTQVLLVPGGKVLIADLVNEGTQGTQPRLKLAVIGIWAPRRHGLGV